TRVKLASSVKVRVGDVLLAHQSARIAGKVASLTTESGAVVAQVEQLPLDEVFKEIVIDEKIDLRSIKPIKPAAAGRLLRSRTAVVAASPEADCTLMGDFKATPSVKIYADLIPAEAELKVALPFGQPYQIKAIVRTAMELTWMSRMPLPKDAAVTAKCDVQAG